MTDTVITVQGSASVEHSPEKATVHVTVSHDGPRRDSALAATTEAADALTTALRGLHDATSGPVIAWSSDRISVWSDRPWNSDGEQLPLIHHTSIGIRASFTDFDALARWVDAAAATSGATIASVDWELLDVTRDQLEAEVRRRAVQNATEKALVYARAAGLTTLAVTAISDAGMLGDPSALEAPRGVMLAAAAHKSAQNLAFAPAELEVSARVDARFTAN